jgi:hypothetical protein
MTEQNGIFVYSEGDRLPELPEHLKSVDFNYIYSPYGFKLAKIDGVEKWQVATEEDYRASEAKRLGIDRAAVKADLPSRGYCQQIGPQQCQGVCPGFFCRLLYNPGAHYYYCQCS